MIHLTGYFNVSNIGDDAICKVITEHLGCVIPDNLSEPANATIVGGGEYDSWMIEGVKNELYATGIGLVRDMIGMKRYKELQRFRQLWVRTHADYRLAKAWGLNPLQGIDSAVLMEPQAEGYKDKIILIPSVQIREIKEYPRYDVSLPLNPFDDNIPQSIKLFNNPQAYLNALVGAEKIITWGRLHAHILGFIAGVEVQDMMPDIKILAWLEMKEKYSLSEMRSAALNMINEVKQAIQ